MENNDLDKMYKWGIRSAFYSQGPKELKAPWYDIDQRMEFQHGREKGKKMAMQALVTGEGGFTLVNRWGDNVKSIK